MTAVLDQLSEHELPLDASSMQGEGMLNAIYYALDGIAGSIHWNDLPIAGTCDKMTGWRRLERLYEAGITFSQGVVREVRQPFTQCSCLVPVAGVLGSSLWCPSIGERVRARPGASRVGCSRSQISAKRVSQDREACSIPEAGIFFSGLAGNQSTDTAGVLHMHEPSGQGKSVSQWTVAAGLSRCARVY